MKRHLHLQIVYIIWLFLASFYATAIPVRLQGSVSSCEIKELKLYKYVNLMQLRLIKKIPVVDGFFDYATDLTEIDSYWLTDPLTETSRLFIWDGFVKININCENMDLSQIVNSPLTKELERFEKERYKLCFPSVTKIDSLISSFKKSSTANTITGRKTLDSLYTQSNKITRESKKLYFTFTANYAQKHPDSFLSLYYLTYTGEEAFESNRYLNEYKEAYNKLSPELKKHSRALIFQ
jgi:hypothetical protein